MAEYNIQMNVFNQAEAGYGQLYPKTKLALVEGLAEQLANKVTGLNIFLTLHVAKTGSDDTGDGSEASPYLTIQKAINSLPRYLIYDATITVHAGVYDENLYIDFFSGGGQFAILGADGETVSVKSITASYNPARLWLQNLMVTGTHNPPYNASLYFSVCPYVGAIGISCTQTVTEQVFGAVRAENGTVLLLKNTTISNKQIALDVTASTVYLNDTDTGANNVTSIRCGSGYGSVGGYVQKGGATIAGVESTAFSGQIF